MRNTTQGGLFQKAKRQLTRKFTVFNDTKKRRKYKNRKEKRKVKERKKI